MTPARIASISICFVAAGVGCCFLTRATLGGSPQQVSSQPRSPHSRRSDAAKHAWHSVPASTPPETEIIPPPPPALPPATSLGFGPEGNHAEAAPASSEVRSPFRLFVGAGAHWRQFATWKQAPTVSGGQREHAKASEPEAHRIRDELERLRKENEVLKKGASCGIRMKVSEKGAVSIYGMGRFPVTLYKEQWLKLLDMSAEIAFIAANEAQLKRKD